MRTLIHNDDLKRLFSGAAMAVVAGLMVGAAIQPPLQDGILAPQQQVAGGGARNYAIGYEHGVGAYPGPVPDYVIGTDYTRPQPLEDQVLAYDDRADTGTAEAADYAQTAEATTPASWIVEGARDEPQYPSVRGNAWNPSDLPAAPEPPEPSEDVEPT
jgi:hypothetical protein